MDPGADAGGPAVERSPFHFGDGCFGWFHDCPGAAPVDAVVVICPPLGHESTRAHRTLRHLADRLARAGIPALRFDYHGTGDSAGSDRDPDRVGQWQRDILAAIDVARARSGRHRVALAGVRFGATLAALVAPHAGADRLVLWNPCLKGRRYARELQAGALAAARVAADAAGGIECGGFFYSGETLAAISAIDLDPEAFAADPRVLVVSPDDPAFPGWPDMMAEHQFTKVPHEALDRLTAWLHRGQTPFPQQKGDTPRWEACPLFHKEKGSVPGLERLCRFGRLFGILTRPDDDPRRAAIVMFNAGSVHHVGPNRIYVEMARALAARGFACLRLDLEGLGDSVGREGVRENHPYPETALEDARAAFDFLAREHGYSRFIALGLCSGAHTAFHAGLAIAEHDIAELVLINPLTYRYREGMSLATVNDFADAQAYRRSMRDPGRWMKLLRGEVNFRRIAELALSRPRAMAKARWGAFLERFVPARAPGLARDLAGILARGRRLTLVIADGDPGRDILMAGARVTATRALRDGRMRLEMIPGADHTFSQSKPREALMRRLEALLAAPVARQAPQARARPAPTRGNASTASAARAAPARR